MEHMSKNEQKKEFMRLYIDYTDLIPSNYLSQVIVKNPNWNTDRVQNVRYGKTHDLAMFKEILAITVPQFSK